MQPSHSRPKLLVTDTQITKFVISLQLTLGVEMRTSIGEDLTECFSTNVPTPVQDAIYYWVSIWWSSVSQSLVQNLSLNTQLFSPLLFRDFQLEACFLKTCFWQTTINLKIFFLRISTLQKRLLYPLRLRIIFVLINLMKSILKMICNPP